MTNYRKCNVCGHIWRTRSSRTPQCSKCKSISCTSATQADYEEFRINSGDAPDNVVTILTVADIPENSTDSDPDIQLPTEENFEDDSEDLETEDYADNEREEPELISKKFVSASPKLLIAVAVGLGLAGVAGVIFFRPLRSNGRPKTRHQKEIEPEPINPRPKNCMRGFK